MQKTPTNNQAGFSIVELMVALLLSMTLGVAVVSVFTNNSHSFNQDENILRSLRPMPTCRSASIVGLQASLTGCTARSKPVRARHIQLRR
jgi:cell division protein FtsN